MFDVETCLFFKTGESVIAIQRVFRASFMLHLYDTVPDRKSVPLLVENFSSSIKRKPPRRLQNAQNPENVQFVSLLYYNLDEGEIFHSDGSPHIPRNTTVFGL